MPNLLKKPKQTPFPKETPPKILQQLTKQKISNNQKTEVTNMNSKWRKNLKAGRIEAEALLRIPMPLCWLNGCR